METPAKLTPAASSEMVKLIRKLRWVGLEEKAEELEKELEQQPATDTVNLFHRHDIAVRTRWLGDHCKSASRSNDRRKKLNNLPSHRPSPRPGTMKHVGSGSRLPNAENG